MWAGGSWESSHLNTGQEVLSFLPGTSRGQEPRRQACPCSQWSSQHLSPAASQQLSQGEKERNKGFCFIDTTFVLMVPYDQVYFPPVACFSVMITSSFSGDWKHGY